MVVEGGSRCVDMCLEKSWNVSLHQLRITPYHLCCSMGGHSCALKNPGMYHSVSCVSLCLTCVSAWGGGMGGGVMVHRCVP